MEQEKPTLDYEQPARHAGNSERLPRAILMGFLGAVGGLIVGIAALTIVGFFNLLPHMPTELDEFLMEIEVPMAFGVVALVWGVISGATRGRTKRG